jgi:hypothetical protein
VVGNNLVLQVGGENLGDYNNDGIVNAVDYTVWRDNLGSNNDLPNDGDIGTPISSLHYELWKSNFGQTAGTSSSTAVPEPAAPVALFMAALFLCGARRSSSSRFA